MSTPTPVDPHNHPFPHIVIPPPLKGISSSANDPGVQGTNTAGGDGVLGESLRGGSHDGAAIHAVTGRRDGSNALVVSYVSGSNPDGTAAFTRVDVFANIQGLNQRIAELEAFIAGLKTFKDSINLQPINDRLDAYLPRLGHIDNLGARLTEVGVIIQLKASNFLFPLSVSFEVDGSPVAIRDANLDIDSSGSATGTIQIGGWDRNKSLSIVALGSTGRSSLGKQRSNELVLGSADIHQ
jgi:hypothetical protein